MDDLHADIVIIPTAAEAFESNPPVSHLREVKFKTVGNDLVKLDDKGKPSQDSRDRFVKQ